MLFLQYEFWCITIQNTECLQVALNFEFELINIRLVEDIPPQFLDDVWIAFSLPINLGNSHFPWFFCAVIQREITFENHYLSGVQGCTSTDFKFSYFHTQYYKHSELEKTYLQNST